MGKNYGLIHYKKRKFYLVIKILAQIDTMKSKKLQTNKVWSNYK